MAIKDGNYITIQSFMVKDLKLKGNELLIYAMIYGFSQNGQTKFTGSLQYLADWTNSTRRGVMKNLKSLTEKGLILKQYEDINNIRFCKYSSDLSIFSSVEQSSPLWNKSVKGVEQSSPGCRTKFTGGVEQSSPNIISNKLSNKLSNNKDIENIYNQFELICNLLPKPRSLTEPRKKAIKSILKSYSTDDVIEVFKNAQSSEFLTVKWQASFDWILKPANFIKILEGNYKNKQTSNPNAINSSFASNDKWDRIAREQEEKERLSGKRI